MSGIIISKIQTILFRRRWVKNNPHNETVPINVFMESSVCVGKHSYGGLRVVNCGKDEKLQIGSFVSIAENVCFVLNADHYTDHISTFPFKSKIIDNSREGVSKGSIIVGDDVWIGYGATILSGVHIGQGAVVAAGSVVTKDVQPYAIVGGIPARVIKYRFDEDVISYLMTIDYDHLDDDLIRDHVDALYNPLDHLSIEEIKKSSDWMPKKTGNSL